MNYSLIFGSMKSTITIVASLVLIKYYLYLSLAPLYSVKKALWQLKMKRKIKRGEIAKKYNPCVSVIIPAWNEGVGIQTTIGSVLAATYNNIEIIVVNDGSKDDTEKKVKELIRKQKSVLSNGKIIKYFYQPNSGKGTALNLGIKKSTGEIILTMDADSAHDSKTIENLVKYFQDPTIDAVVGNVKVAHNNTIVGTLQKLEYTFGFYFKRVHSLFNAEYIFGGACAAFRKKTTFSAIGLFDTQNKTEDIEYSMRTKLYGLKSVYAEDVVAFTEGASDLKGLFKQRLRWKKGRFDTFGKYKSLFFSTNKNHSKFLSWVILPYALFGELQMLFEPMFFALIWAYTLVSGDYLSIGLSSLFIFFTFISACLFGDRKTNKLYVLYFPAYWLLFYALVGVEFLALVKSLELVLGHQDVVWQNWQRKGITEVKKQLA